MLLTYYIIIIIGLITLLSVSLLRNLHMSQTIGGVMFSQGKAISPIP